MSVLIDFIIADNDSGPAIAEAEMPSEQWPCLEGWKGILTIELSTLHFCILGQDPSVDEVVDLSSEFDLVGGDEDDGTWVMKMPATVMASIASLPESDIRVVAEKWTSTEELQISQWGTDDAIRFITEIQLLISTAASENKCIFLWVSL